MGYKYHAFISYSHSDKKWADWLHKTLETYQIPSSIRATTNGDKNKLSSKLTPIFRDREELPTSSGLSSAIMSALEESKYLIVICSPNSAKSKYVNREIVDFKHHHGEENVLAIIVSGEPYALDKLDRFNPDEEAFPLALKYHVDSEKNLTDRSVEPIAADAREIGDGKERAKIKLIAGLLGVGFDDLWKREQRRQKKRKIIFISLVAIVFIVISSLSIFSLLQWKDAEHQKKIAVKGREAAEQLVDHTLFDLRDKLEPIGQLELLYSTQKAVDEYYKTLGNPDMSMKIEFRRSAYYANSGNYFKSIGNIKEAKEHFESAMKIMKMIIENYPNIILYQRNLVVIYSELGGIEENFGNSEKAKEYYVLSQKILKPSVKNDPLNYHLQFDLAKNDVKLGNIYRSLGQTEEAGKYLQLGLKTMQNLMQFDADNDQWKQDIAITHISNAVLFNFLNKYEKALPHFEEALRIRKTLSKKHPANFLNKHSLAESYSYMGEITSFYLDQPLEAKKHFEAALDIMMELTEYDNLNTQWKHSLARIHHKIADTELYLNNHVKGLSHYRKAFTILEELLKVDPSNLNLQYEFALECGRVGSLQLEFEKHEEAKKYFEIALETMKKLVEIDPSSFLYQYTLAMVYSDLSNLYRENIPQVSVDSFFSNVEKMLKESEKLGKGLKYFEQSISILNKLKKDDPDNPLWLTSGHVDKAP